MNFYTLNPIIVIEIGAVSPLLRENSITIHHSAGGRCVLGANEELRGARKPASL
jgi:hypothetical protein